MDAFYCMQNITEQSWFFFYVKVKIDKESVKNCLRLKKTKETSQLNELCDTEHEGKTPTNDIIETVDKI